LLYGLLLGLHVLICISLVITVLLQSGKGGGLAGAFGGGGGAGQTMFGGRGAATFLSKATTVLGAAFMTSSLVLALMGGGGGPARSVLRQGPAPGTAPPANTQPLQIPGSESLTLPPAQDTEGGEAPEAGAVGEPATTDEEEGSPSPSTSSGGDSEGN